MASVVLGLVVGYLFGAIPVGFLVGKAWGVDVRQHGSGRTGGTNVWRAAGVLPAVLTVLGDIIKGVLAVWLVRTYVGGEWAAALSATGAVLGHNWPVWLRFRGGAGGMVGAATMTVLNPMAATVVLPLALVNLFLTRYASIGTLTVGLGGVLMLAGVWVWHSDIVPLPHVVYGLCIAAAIIWSLRPNIIRLREGTERRITLW